MNLSLFELFKTQSGSSSSHTLAPLNAGALFVKALKKQDLLHASEEINIEFFGSFALIGQSQYADVACVLGLMGYSQQALGEKPITEYADELKASKILKLNDQRHIIFDWQKNIQFHSNKQLDTYSNAIGISVKKNNGDMLSNKIYYSTGAGNVIENANHSLAQNNKLPYPFLSMFELRTLCETQKKTMSQIVMENELSQTKEKDASVLNSKIDELWHKIKVSIEKGVQSNGILPGSLNIPRRAPYLHQMIKSRVAQNEVVENEHWVNLFAMAVSEENAAGGEVIGAPSNGSAGVIAAVLAYYNKFVSHEDKQGIRIFISTAAAIGALYKSATSIYSPQLGCQGEIGVACSMAAAGLTAAKNGSVEQIEYAAQLAMEHNLGLTCDPAGGLVQIPCITRNCMAAVKAINASRLAMTSTIYAEINLDKMIMAMQQSGLSMNTQYKEQNLGAASQNNIAVNIVYC